MQSSSENDSVTNEEFPFFKVKNLNSPRFIKDFEHTVSQDTAKRLNAEIFPTDTIVFAKVGAALLLNRFRILAQPSCIDNNMIGLVLDHQCERDFLFHLFNQIEFSELFNQGPVPSVNGKQVGYITIPLPPLAEQKRIAAYLDASCAAIDRAVEAKQKQLETLDALRKSIITPAVLRGLDSSEPLQETGNAWLPRIPNGWKLVALKRVSETQTGITLGKSYDPPLIERPYLRTANVQDGYLDLEKITTIEIPESLATRYELRPGDVLMTEGGDLDKLGRGFPWEGQIPGCLHQNHVFAIRPILRLLLPEFLTFVTASRYGRDYFEATGKRTTNLASTNSTKVGLFPIPLPSITTQQKIVDYINEKLFQARRIEETIIAQITTLTAYRKSLIHECVTGKRRISDMDVAQVKAHV